MIKIQGGWRIPPHVGYGNRGADGVLRPRHCQTKNVRFLSLTLGWSDWDSNAISVRPQYCIRPMELDKTMKK